MTAVELATGRWPGILAHLGIDPNLLTGKHVPCPACNGRDRFRFDDKEGRGTYICSHCGSGDGFSLLEMAKGWTFKQSAFEIERVAGSVSAVEPKRSQSDGEKLDRCRSLWNETKAVVVGDPVYEYILRRTGAHGVPKCIQFHPSLNYFHDDGSLTRHPAMIALVTGADGKNVALHLTYLTCDGKKAGVPTVRKVFGSLPASSAVRLFPASDTLGIAEGIETALSASVRFGVPVWSCISAGGMEKWAPPAGTKRVVIFGDNDLSFTGQVAAYSLAKRLVVSGIKAVVKIPETAGNDWNDEAQLDMDIERSI